MPEFDQVLEQDYEHDCEVERLLQSEIDSLVSLGCVDYSGRLGFAKVPKGYAVILNADHSHFFYIRHDGKESCICWDKWTVLRWIKQDANNQ